MPDIDVIRTVVPLPLMPLPVASPLVHLGDRHVLISPGSRITEAEFRAMGPVTDLVAPNMGHAAGIAGAARFFPEARRWAVPGLAAKRKDVTFTDELREDTWPYAEALPMLALDGMPGLREAVFFHKKSRTLIVTDLAFHWLDVSGVFPSLVTRMMGSYRRFAVSRVIGFMTKDRAAAQASLDKLFAWDFDRVIVSHGSVLESGGKAKLAEALRVRGFQAPG